MSFLIFKPTIAFYSGVECQITFEMPSDSPSCLKSFAVFHLMSIKVSRALNAASGQIRQDSVINVFVWIRRMMVQLTWHISTTRPSHVNHTTFIQAKMFERFRKIFATLKQIKQPLNQQRYSHINQLRHQLFVSTNLISNRRLSPPDLDSTEQK